MGDVVTVLLEKSGAKITARDNREFTKNDRNDKLLSLATQANTNETDTHDKRVWQMLNCLEGNGVTCKLVKCSFSKTEQEFVGHCITSQGVQPFRSKLDAIKNFPKPTNITELRRSMGTANHLSIIQKTQEPLRDLLSLKMLGYELKIIQNLKGSKKCPVKLTCIRTL